MTITLPRWITFDQQTAHDLRSRFPAGIVSELRGGNALHYALSNSGSVVTVLKTGLSNQCAVAVFHHAAAARTGNKARLPRIVASGILGLGDETLFEEEQEEARPKSWWRRLWED